MQSLGAKLSLLGNYEIETLGNDATYFTTAYQYISIPSRYSLHQTRLHAWIVDTFLGTAARSSSVLILACHLHITRIHFKTGNASAWALCCSLQRH
jgi:hypothetical protein